ncbi:MAG: hypothetical protein IKF64_02910 [Eubacterium sp.]|nr:hypothetical protein [Eubacterium sp.]
MKKERAICSAIAVLLAGGIIMTCLAGCGGTKYSVDYNGSKDSFKGAKDAYREGASVTLIYRKELIGTDTDYSFYLDDERLNPEYKEDKGYVLKFKMPAHDVSVKVSAVNSMIAPSDDEEYKKEAVVSFHSFDGGGPSFSATIDDPSVVKYEHDIKYNNPKHAEMEGSGFDVYFTFTGLQPGSTSVKIEERSPIAGNFDHYYDVKVDSSLELTVTHRETVELN